MDEVRGFDARAVVVAVGGRRERQLHVFHMGRILQHEGGGKVHVLTTPSAGLPRGLAIVELRVVKENHRRGPSRSHRRVMEDQAGREAQHELHDPKETKEDDGKRDQKFRVGRT
jgi:hypothetical protein